MVRRFTILSLLLIGSVLFSTAGFGETIKYDHSIDVETMHLSWKLDADAIHIKVSAKTTSWVGVGFNPTAEMKDANIIIGYVKKGKVKVADHFGNRNRQHEADKRLGGKQNVKDVAGKEENGITEIQFTIPLDSGDKTDRAISTDKPNKVMLAHGAGRDSFRTKHVFKTLLSVDLKTGKFEKLM